MKLVNTNGTLEYFFNIKDLSIAVNRSANTIWCWIKRYKLLDAPSIRLDNRDYYNKDTFERLVKEISEIEAL